MSEESTSIWKRPIKGWRLFVARLAVLASLTVVLALLIRFCLIPSSPDDRVFWWSFIGIVLFFVFGFLFVRWVCCWRNLRRLLIGLACLVTLLALFYAEENFRGKRAWEKYRRELEARGEQLDFKAFIPKPIPDDQNFAATPLIRSWFPKGNSKVWNDGFEHAELKVKKDKLHRSMVDLNAWARAFSETNSPRTFEPGQLDPDSRAQAAPAVLKELEKSEPIFAELRAASGRPDSHYPVDYDVEDPFSILLPHLSSMRPACRRLQLKACAELAAGRSGAALEDVNLILYMTQSLKDEPFLISYLVRLACLQHALQPIWEGLAEHRWSDAQLQELQTHLQQCNFVADVKHPLQTERAAGVAIVNVIRKRGLGYLNDIGGAPAASRSVKTAANPLGVLVPSGWLYLEQYNLSHAYQELMDGAFDPAQRRVFPDRSEANVRNSDRSILGHGDTFDALAAIFVHHRVLAAMLLPALDRVLIKAAIGQTVTDQAALACALERYRLANGQFPDNLDALVPAFVSKLPHDPITGEPYKYRHTDDGRFVLYSVGWNEKDDGGVPGKTDFDDKEGDWVWQYPPLP